MRVLIIGAGIGGLAAARALSVDGHQVTVFEQAPGLRAGGAAVTLWSNGTGILGELGVLLDGAGAPIDVLETRDRHGRLLLRIDVAQAAARYGHPHICLPRRRLLERLAGSLSSGVISFSRACTGVGQDREGVHAEFADGTAARGDLLIGADGRGSAVRDQIWGSDPAELTGWATWQGVSPIPASITSSHRSVLFIGRAGTCGLMPPATDCCSGGSTSDGHQPRHRPPRPSPRYGSTSAAGPRRCATSWPPSPTVRPGSSRTTGMPCRGPGGPAGSP